MTPAIAAEEQLSGLLKASFDGRAGEFRPCAIYHERLDYVRVIVRDCSITSTRINEIVTVLEDSHYKPGQGIERYIGFTIKGVRHFCKSEGINIDSPVKIAAILDAVLRAFPDREVELAIDGIARRFVDETEVDLKTSNVVMMKQAA